MSNDYVKISVHEILMLVTDYSNDLYRYYNGLRDPEKANVLKKRRQVLLDRGASNENLDELAKLVKKYVAGVVKTKDVKDLIQKTVIEIGRNTIKRSAKLGVTKFHLDRSVSDKFPSENV